MELIYSFDTEVSRIVGRWPRQFKLLMRIASFIGEPVVVIGTSIIAILIARQTSHPEIAWGFVASIAAFAICTLLKLFLHRTRPDTLYVTTMRFKSYSFPSGHTFGSALIFGLILYLAASQLQQPWDYLAVIFGIPVILLVGLSRVYLGAHFPSDVVGGWFLSLLFLIIIIKLFFQNG
jgi:undecaprenyl-diphosphatase